MHSRPYTHLVTTPGGEVTCFEWPGASPIIVLLTGMGIPAQSWWSSEDEPLLQKMMTEPYFLAPVMAERFHVVAYDRAGIGTSTAPTQPRTLTDLIQELHAVLTHLTAGPVILLGHSIGGLVAFQYAQQHPTKVVGLILLDTSHPHQLQRLNKWRPEGEKTAYVTMLQRIREEHPERLDFDALFKAGESVQGDLGELPLLVISRGIPATSEELQVGDEPLSTEVAEQMSREWQAMQSDLAASSMQSKHVIAVGSRHYPHFDELKWTAAQILSFLDGFAPAGQRTLKP